MLSLMQRVPESRKQDANGTVSVGGAILTKTLIRKSIPAAPNTFSA